MRSAHLLKSKLERLGQAEARSLTPESPVGVSERSTEVRRKGEQEGGAMLATMGQPGIGECWCNYSDNNTYYRITTSNIDMCEWSFRDQLNEAPTRKQRAVGHVQS